MLRDEKIGVRTPHANLEINVVKKRVVYLFILIAQIQSITPRPAPVVLLIT